MIFDDLSVSERIRILSDRYYEDKTTEGMERIEQEYGMSSRNIARYVRCDRLISGFKAMLDEGTLTIAAGVDISFLPEPEQIVVLDVLVKSGIQLSRNIAKELRLASGTLTVEKVQEIFGVDKPAKEVVRAMSVVLSPQVYIRFFADVAVKDVQGIVEKALENYFEGKGV